MPSGWQNLPSKISLESTPPSTSLETVLSSTPPWSLRAVVESSAEPPCHCSRPRSSPLYTTPSPLTRADDIVDHAGAIPKPVTPFPSLQQCCPPQDCDAVHPMPFPSLRRRRTHTIPEPAPPPSSPSPQGYKYCICFFVILGLQILILICYIATLF
jgi:hypothetical protein